MFLEGRDDGVENRGRLKVTFSDRHLREVRKQLIELDAQVVEEEALGQRLLIGEKGPDMRLGPFLEKAHGVPLDLEYAQALKEREHILQQRLGPHDLNL